MEIHGVVRVGCFHMNYKLKRAYLHKNHTRCSLARSEYSVSLAGGGDNTAASGNTGPVCRLPLVEGLLIVQALNFILLIYPALVVVA